MTTNTYTPILAKFPITEEVIDVRPIGNGHINDTLGVTVRQPDGTEDIKYVLQRINHEIFTDVETLQKNIFAVTEHIRKHLQSANEPDVDRKVLTFIRTKEGEEYAEHEGGYWRLSYFIPGSKSYDNVTPELAEKAGEAFGDFHNMLSDLPEPLGETIPNFHNMPFRLEELRTAVKEDRAGRVSEVQELLTELERRADAMCIQEKYSEEGKLVKRTTHCDTKVNNVLFDKESDECLCVIDLDTVMPGYVLSDIGDFIRTAVNTGAEDEEELSKVQVDMEIFKAFTRGYMVTAQKFLTPLEIQLLPYGGRLLTYMQAVRFLTDYLNGDTYYKTHKPKHNLIRTVAQFEFLLRLEEHQEEMDDFMKQWL
ncbi:MAG: aminoglycoside phosphotransferase family protein [Porphyromonas sp.]|nr:aminoglycoside phosphotransferase family protein [Porphyromonas sp.]